MCYTRVNTGCKLRLALKPIKVYKYVLPTDSKTECTSLCAEFKYKIGVKNPNLFLKFIMYFLTGQDCIYKGYHWYSKIQNQHGDSDEWIFEVPRFSIYFLDEDEQIGVSSSIKAIEPTHRTWKI